MKAEADAKLVAEKNQWDAEISAVRNRLVVVETELAEAHTTKTDAFSKYTRSLQNEILVLKKREEVHSEV